MMNRTHIRRILPLLACLGLVYTGLAQGAGTAAYKVDCTTYKKYLAPSPAFKSDDEQLRKLPFHLFELDKLASTCKVPGSKLDGAFKAFFRYNDVAEETNGPQGQKYDPNASDSDIEKQKADLDKQLVAIQEDLKKGDVASLKTVIRYIVWENDDPPAYILSALELMARAFPEDYDSLKDLTPEHSTGRDLWESIKQEWITP